MLKKLSSKYNDYSKGNKWVKLKKDFIPGTGDTKDFSVVGASWEKERGRILGGEYWSSLAVIASLTFDFRSPDLCPHDVFRGLSRQQLRGQRKSGSLVQFHFVAGASLTFRVLE